MPIFDLQCPKCEGIAQDVVLSIRITKDEMPECPDCNVKMDKLPSRTNAHFKGAGFYCTDYRAPTRG